MNTVEWVRAVTNDTAREIAKKAGVPERTLQHQLAKGQVSIENAVRIAAAYNHHPLHALVELGVIDRAWESVPNIQAALQFASDEELTDEILRRLNLATGAESKDFHTPIDQLVGSRTKVVFPSEPLLLVDEKEQWDLAARNLGDEPVGRKIRRAQDEAGELPDDEGPDGGA